MLLSLLGRSHPGRASSLDPRRTTTHTLERHMCLLLLLAVSAVRTMRAMLASKS